VEIGEEGTVDCSVLECLLDSMKDPVVFVDVQHVIRYTNRAAIAAQEGGANLVGRSLFDCHSDASKGTILANVERLRSGEEEILVSQDSKQRILMRAVRDERGELVGYYERYEPVT